MIVNCREAIPVVRTLLFLAAIGCLASAADGDLQSRVSQFESSGNLAGARSLLTEQAASSNDSATAQTLAEFLCRHADPGCRDATLKWASGESDPVKKKLALRQVVLLDYMKGREADLAGDLTQYRAAGGAGLDTPSKHTRGATYSMVTIPGPISSFARMAALSPDLAPEELLLALAR
ncbi:MAG TPA: hypothetical protein VK493_10155, partial [Bryobacteraceae bacterium]|nr:hypothetical protein [Bryobacteraceae bacterium]